MARGMNSAPKDKVLYMYGITPHPSDSVSIPGVDGKAPVESIKCGALICWMSRVAKSEFADNLSANMANLDWLAAMSTRHQETVSAISQTADILPARFGTVFLTETSLRSDIQERRSELLADFKRIRGCQEWGVKVFASQPGKIDLPSSLKTGKDYLKAKSAMLHSRTRKAPDQEITRFAQALEKVSETAAEGGRISGGRRDLAFQVSLLVKRGNRRKLEAILRRFSSKWKGSRQIECSGPWPPYSFVSRSIQ
jgi:hypothetical protein